MWFAKLASKSSVFLVIGAALVFVIGLGSAGLFGLLGLKIPFQSNTVDRSQPALLLSVQELSQYHAAVGNFEVLLDIEDDVAWVPSFVAGRRSLFVAAGTVNAYIDFADFAEENLALTEDGTQAVIRLPRAQLDKPNLDQERTYLYSQERGVINRYGDALSTQDQSDLYRQAERKLASAAAESELKQQAEENTRTMLTGLFGSLGIAATFADPVDSE